MCLHVGKRLDCYYHTEYLLKYLDVFSFSVFLFVSFCLGFFFLFFFPLFTNIIKAQVLTYSSVGWFGLAADKLKVFWVFFCREMECNRVYNRQRGNQ